MSDTVDNVLNTVSEAAESEPAEDVVVNEEAPVEEAPAEEVPVEEEPEPEPEPATSVPVSTQEVVQNVQEILSSTETNVSVDNSESNDLEERVKVLEERLEKLIKYLSNNLNSEGKYKLEKCLII